MYVLLSFDKQTSAQCSYVTFAASRNELLHKTLSDVDHRIGI